MIMLKQSSEDLRVSDSQTACCILWLLGSYLQFIGFTQCILLNCCHVYLWVNITKIHPDQMYHKISRKEKLEMKHVIGI